MKHSVTDLPSRWLRIFLPLIIVLIWLSLGGIGGPYFGKISQVSSNNLTDFLPGSADATKVQQLSADFRQSSNIPAVIVIESQQKLSAMQLVALGQAQKNLSKIAGVDGRISPVIPAQDGKAAEIVALLDTHKEVSTVVGLMHTGLKQDIPGDLGFYVAGPAGFTSDLSKAFAGIDGLLLLVALVVVFLILLLVYRSVVLPLIVLLTSIFALSASILLIWWLAHWNVVQINGQVQGILFILVIGATTDYALLYASRFKEALRHTQSTIAATQSALKGSLEPILASGGTVIAGLLCLLLSDLNSNKFLGPVAAIGIVFAMTAALSLLPSMLLLLGRKAFWPVAPHFEGDIQPVELPLPSTGVWAGLARLVDRQPRALWVAILLLLVMASINVSNFKAAGIANSALIVGPSEYRSGQEALSRHFAGGSGDPAIIIISSNKTDQAVGVIESTGGIGRVDAMSQDSPSGTVPLGENKVRFGPLASATPTIINQRVMLQATLNNEPDSSKAELTITRLRTNLMSVDSSALVGGSTAASIDTKVAAVHDRNTIIPVALIVITIILMFLLRAMIAPLILIGTTIVSFLATLGVGALFFNGVLHLPGSDPSVPLYAFIFLVALGIDYNIFLMTRVREEALRHGTREGILRGLIVTGGVITSAGVVLAATFAALSVIPILFLLQIAFLVSFGVLLDTLIVRSILVPAILVDLGPISWWPSALRHKP
jgi:RND superfamily putative drug exporter